MVLKMVMVWSGLDRKLDAPSHIYSHFSVDVSVARRANDAHRYAFVGTYSWGVGLEE
jgi:hypothetical protein